MLPFSFVRNVNVHFLQCFDTADLYKTKDDQTTGFSCSALTLQVEWQKSSGCSSKSLLCESTGSVSPGCTRKKAIKRRVFTACVSVCNIVVNFIDINIDL